MKLWLAALTALTLAGCGRSADRPGAEAGDASPVTKQAQAAVASALPRTAGC